MLNWDIHELRNVDFIQIGLVYVQNLNSHRLPSEIPSFHYFIVKNPQELVFSCRCRKLPKALKEWEAFNALSKKINDFNESCPLLELMANKAMKDRHWDRIAKCTGHTFDLESDTFALRNIMEADLLPHKEDIEVSYLIDDITITTSPFKANERLEQSMNEHEMLQK